MTTTTINQNLFDLVNSFDTAAKIPALRTIVHSTMARCIGAIRQDIRNRKTQERNTSPQTDIDQRNADDSIETPPPPFGFSERESAIFEASKLHAVYDWALTDLVTLTTSKWDMPLSPKDMLGFMADNSRKLSPLLVTAISEAAGIDENDVSKVMELQAMKECEQLQEETPEILATFEGFGDNGYEDAIAELPAVTLHQIGVKIVHNLRKAQNNVITSVVRTRRMTDLGSIPLIKDAIANATKWVHRFEHLYGDELRAARDNGANLLSVN